MRQSLRWSLIAMLLLIPLSSCDKGGGADDEDAVWPEQPENGQPVTLEFQEMIGEGEELGADMRVFNFTETAVERMNLTLHYLNEAGEELDTFPFSISSPEVVGASGTTVVEVGAFVPAETVRIEAEVTEVNFAGGESWSAE